ncbi:hypothetical protein [Sorangium sp. So ce233]
MERDLERNLLEAGEGLLRFAAVMAQDPHDVSAVTRRESRERAI